MDFSNNTTTTLSPDAHHYHGILISALILIAVAASVVLTVIGNTLICMAVLFVRKLRHPPNYLLVSLALTDLGVGAIVEPLAAVREIWGAESLGLHLCSFYTSADVTLCTVSILTLCSVSVDRYLAVTKPLIYCPKRTTNRMLIYILLVWILALLISVPPLLVFRPDSTSSSICQVSQNVIYQISATLGSFYIPACIILIVNYKIFKAVRGLALAEERTLGTVNSIRGRSTSSANVLDKQNSHPDSNSERVSRLKVRLRGLSPGANQNQNNSRTRRKAILKETKAMKTLSVITGAFLINWSPFFILAVIKPLCGSRCYIPAYLDTLFLWLGYINSAVNPLLYAKFNKDFRVPFREMLCCRFKSLRTVLRREEFAETFGGSAQDLNSIALQQKLIESSTFEHLQNALKNGTIQSNLNNAATTPIDSAPTVTTTDSAPALFHTYS